MSEFSDPPEGLARIATVLEPGMALLPTVAIMFVAMFFAVPDGVAGLALISAAVTLLLVYSALRIALGRHRAGTGKATSDVARVVAKDPAPHFLTAADGEILYRNAAAEARFGPTGSAGMSGLMRDLFAHPGGVLRRLRHRAALAGTASEDIVTPRGQARLSVHELQGRRYLWRLQDFTSPAIADGDAGQEVAIITLGRSDAVLFMNAAARRLIGGRPKSLDALLGGHLLRPGEVHEIRTRNGPERVRMLELGEVAGRREFMLIPETTETAVSEVETPSLDAYFEILPIPLLMVETDGHVSIANPPARELLGVECRPGAALASLLEGLGRSINDWLSEAAGGRKPVHSEFLRLSQPDREVFVQVTLKCMRHEGRDTLLAVLSDATELKTLEAQFVQSQKMQAIGQLAGGVAHDFNNLLTAISGHCDLLLLRHDAGDPDYSDLIQINQNANRAAALVGQLLAFSRKQTLRPQFLDLRDTLSDLTHLLNRLVGEKVTLSLSHDPLLRPIRADKRQLEQVMMNLVVNARDAMPEGGEIRIETETLRLTDPLRRDRAEVAPGEYVSVKVMDTGHGISPDKIVKVFEPFFTTKAVGEGTGLGLSTAYGIVKQTGGFIFVDSEPGHGTTFTLLFPVPEAVAPTEIAPQPVETKVEQDDQGASAPAASEERVVLLVEDEAPVRAFASQALRLRGLTVLEAESAEAALAQLEDPDLKVDLFVTDVIMPGMDGPTWVRKALETRPDVRVIFVSGYAEEHFTDDSTQIANSVFLPKPFSLTELTETVQQQLA